MKTPNKLLPAEVRLFQRCLEGLLKHVPENDYRAILDEWKASVNAKIRAAKDDPEEP